MSQVSLDKIGKKFRSPRGEETIAISDLTLSIEAGEFFVFVGPSGAGKSTLLRLIAGLERATAGSLTLDGQPANQVPPDKRDVAMVFQQDALFPHLTIKQNIGLGLRLQKLPKAETDKRVREAAEWLELGSHLQRFPRELSGGERQRVALARAMVRKPRIFLFDEPLSNLDPPWRERLRNEIRRAYRELKATVIYVTHDQAEAMSLADRLAVLDNGSLQQVGTPSQIYDVPANLFVATFFGSPSMNVLNGQLTMQDGQSVFEVATHRRTVRVPPAMLKSLGAFVNKSLVLGLRPEHIRIASDGLPATIDHAERLGSEIILHLLVGKEKLRAKVPAEGKFVNGQSCHLELLMERAHWFDPNIGLRLT